MSDTQRLPNLYQLLGLNGLESNREKITAAIQRAQVKAESLKADAARAADLVRLQKVVALGQKYLLSRELKSTYDAQWKANFGAPGSASAALQSAEPVTAGATEKDSVSSQDNSSLLSTSTSSKSTPTSTSSTASTGTITKDISSQLSWDMAALEALLPAADPHAPFQMADYLRSSQVRDPLAAEADLHKLIALLGGEIAPSSQPVVGQPIGMQHLAEGIHLNQVDDDESGRVESRLGESGLSMPRTTNSAAAVGLAKRMRQKRQQAMLLGGTVLLAGVGGLVLLGFYLNQPARPSTEVAHVTEPPQPKPSLAEARQVEPTAGNEPTTIPPPGPSVLIQPGADVKPLEIQAAPLSQPNAMAMPEKPAEPTPEPAKPEPAKPEPAKPEPAKPEPAKPEPAKPEPEPAKPEVQPEEPADLKLNAKEKKQWQEEMKRARASLVKLDASATEKLLGELKPLAKNAQQRTQLKTLEQAVGLIRKAREAIVAGIGGLESAETFTVGSSTEIVFIEGDETRIIVRAAGRRQEFKLEAMPVGIAVAIMKLKPNVIDANLEAAMGVYIMVQPKATASNATQGQKLLDDAAAVGAISKELAQFHKDDYKLQ